MSRDKVDPYPRFPADPGQMTRKLVDLHRELGEVINEKRASLVNGYVPTDELGSGTASSSTYLRGDYSWATPSGTGSGAPTDAQYLVAAANSSLSAEVVVTAAGLALLDDASAAAQRTTLGVDVLLDGKKPYLGVGNRDSLTLSYDKTTRKVTITGAADIWINGVKTTKATPYVFAAHTNATGGYFFYFDDAGTETVGTSAWDLATDVPIAYVYYNASLADGVAFSELHNAVRDPALHATLHFTLGTQVEGGSGFAASGYALNSDTDANKTLAIASGVIWDEDIKTTCTAVADNGPYTIWYRSGASGDWTWTTTDVVPFKSDGTDIQYNQNTGATWQLTSMTGTSFVNMWAFAAPSITAAQQIVFVVGQATHSTLAAAQSEALSSITWGTMPFQEIAPLYQITYRRAASNNNAGKADMRAIARLAGAKSTTSLSSAQYTAAGTSFTPAGNIAATNVQAALEELDAEKQPLATVLTNTTASFTTAQESKLSGIATGAEVNVNADWNAGSGDAQILNKPTLGGAASLNVGTTAGTVAAGDHNHTGVYQASDAQLTDLAALAYTGNSLKVVRVNTGETAFELATLAGGGDVTGPSSSVDNEIALFSSTTGKVIKRASTTGVLKATSGVIAAATAGTDYGRPYTLVATLAGDQATAANTTPVTLTGLVWTFETNSVYFFRWIGAVTPAAATTGCGFQLDVSAAVTEISMGFYHQLANTGTLSGGHSIADDASVGVSSGLPGTSTYPAIGHGMLRTGANSGTAQLRFRSETTAVITAKAGMTLVVEKVT